MIDVKIRLNRRNKKHNEKGTIHSSVSKKKHIPFESLHSNLHINVIDFFTGFSYSSLTCPKINNRVIIYQQKLVQT